MRMDLRKRKMAEYETETIAQLIAQLLDDRMRRAAMRTLVISVLDQGRDRSVAEQMIAVVDRWRELAHDVLPACSGNDSKAVRMPSAPGLTPIGDTKLQ